MKTPAYEPTRTVAIGILTRTISDEIDTLIPEGSAVFITRLTTGFNGNDSYACVATVAVNKDGVATGWRLLVPIDAVTVKSSMQLHMVAKNYGTYIAEACDDEACSG